MKLYYSSLELKYLSYSIKRKYKYISSFLNVNVYVIAYACNRILSDFKPQLISKPKPTPIM